MMVNGEQEILIIVLAEIEAGPQIHIPIVPDQRKVQMLILEGPRYPEMQTVAAVVELVYQKKLHAVLITPLVRAIQKPGIETNRGLLTIPLLVVEREIGAKELHRTRIIQEEIERRQLTRPEVNLAERPHTVRRHHHRARIEEAVQADRVEVRAAPVDRIEVPAVPAVLIERDNFNEKTKSL
jgi:urease beta subunit